MARGAVERAIADAAIAAPMRIRRRLDMVSPEADVRDFCDVLLDAGS
jgi:hypothetical protein